MRIVVRLATGSVPVTEHLEPGELVFDPDLRRIGAGIGGVAPVWYPSIDIDGHLALLSGQKITSRTNASSIVLDANGPAMAYLGYNIIDFAGVDLANTRLIAANKAGGAAPTLGAAGSPTNIALKLHSKGTGEVQLATNNGADVQAAAQHVAGAVNYVTLRGSLSNAPVTISADGTSNTIDLMLSPKGPGHIRLDATWTAVASSPVTNVNGYITVKDKNGTLRKIATVA